MQKKAQKSSAKKIELLKSTVVALTVKERKVIAGGNGTSKELNQPLQPASYGCTL